MLDRIHPARPSALRRPRIWIAIVVAVVVAAAFSPSLLNEFLDYDDADNVVNNVGYRGLGLTQLRWMLTTVHIGHWMPVTWVTLAFDYLLWGMNPAGYHLTNVVLHALAAALVYLVALRLLGTAPWSPGARHAGAAAAALFWGLHPLRAESVAWVTERRDVLSTALFLLAVLLYLRAHDARISRRRLLGVSVVMFALGIASKSMVMTLPAVLVILDVYPLRRIRAGAAHWHDTRAVLIEKAPYLALGVAAAALGYYGQQANQFFTSLDHYPWTARVAITGYAYAFYVGKTVLPIGLSPLYELPARVALFDLQCAAGWVATIAITLGALALRRRVPIVLAAWAYYLVTLAPVSGIAHAGHQIANDRYTYLPSLGFAIVFGAGVAVLVQPPAAIRRAYARAGVAAVAALLLALATLTAAQVQIWRTTGALWMAAIDSEPACSICHANLAAWLTNQGHFEAAIQEYRIAMSLRPDRNAMHHSLGIAFLNANRLDEAIAEFEQRRIVRPNDATNLVVMGTALMRRQLLPDAERTLAQALAITPDDAVGRATYAETLARQKRWPAAIGECQRAITLGGHDRTVRFMCSRVLAHGGDLDGARAHLRELGRMDVTLASRLARELATVRARP